MKMLLDKIGLAIRRLASKLTKRSVKIIGLVFFGGVVLLWVKIISGQPHHVPAIETQNILNKLLAERGPLTFVSRSGKYYYMDSDTTVTIKTNQQVELVEYGFAVQMYCGTYSIDKKGEITLALPNYQSFWPAMLLCTLDKDFYLQTASGRCGFIMGERAASYQSSRMAPFWPFKLIKENASMVDSNPDTNAGSTTNWDPFKPFMRDTKKSVLDP